eukprot:scaffold47533_cov18-Tisochrysis_lutea.AAC.2
MSRREGQGAGCQWMHAIVHPPSIASLQDEQERRSRWQRGGNKRESLQYRGGNKYISTENRYPAPVPRGGAGARTAYVLGRHKPAIAMHCCC